MSEQHLNFISLTWAIGVINRSIKLISLGNNLDRNLQLGALIIVPGFISIVDGKYVDDSEERVDVVRRELLILFSIIRSFPINTDGLKEKGVI